MDHMSKGGWYKEIRQLWWPQTGKQFELGTGWQQNELDWGCVCCWRLTSGHGLRHRSALAVGLAAALDSEWKTENRWRLTTSYGKAGSVGHPTSAEKQSFRCRDGTQVREEHQGAGPGRLTGALGPLKLQ